MNSENQRKVELLYELYEQAMYRVAFSVLKNEAEAEDAVSESFVVIIKSLRKIDLPESEMTKRFILKTIKNKSIDMYRSIAKKREKALSIDEYDLQSNENVEDNAINREIISGLEMGDDEKELIYLRECQELSWKEISERLDISESAARKRFERLKRKLVKR